MKKNNYDNKSNDHSIECLTFYDTDISQMYFKDNITILQHSGYSKSCVAFFHESGKNHDDIIDFTVKGSKSEMVRFLWPP